MHHFDASAAIGVLVGSVLAYVVAMLVALKVRRSVLAGEALDRWQSARRRLSLADQWRVSWATTRRQPIDRAGLAQAQVACARFRQDAAERSPYLRKAWMRVALPMVYGVLALGYAVTAVVEHGQGRVLPEVMAALFAVICVLWTIAVPQSLRRQSERMAQLRRRIEDRYAG